MAETPYSLLQSREARGGFTLQLLWAGRSEIFEVEGELVETLPFWRNDVEPRKFSFVVPLHRFPVVAMVDAGVTPETATARVYKRDQLVIAGRLEDPVWSAVGGELRATIVDDPWRGDRPFPPAFDLTYTPIPDVDAAAARQQVAQIETGLSAIGVERNVGYEYRSWEHVIADYQEYPVSAVSLYGEPVVSDAYWASRAARTQGRVYPYPFGRPGTHPATPAILVDTTTDSEVLLIAGAALPALSAVTVYGPNPDGDIISQTLTCSVVTDDNGRTVTVADGSAAFDLISTSAFAPDPESDFWVAWTNGTAAQTALAGAGLGDLIRFCLSQASVRVDGGSLLLDLDELNGYAVGGYIDETVDGLLVDWLLPRLEAFPVRLVNSRSGLFVWRYDPESQRPVREVRCYSGGNAMQDGDLELTERRAVHMVELRYQHDDQHRQLRQTARSPVGNGDEVERFESDIIADAATAERCVRERFDALSRRGLVARYWVPEEVFRDVRIGDFVVVDHPDEGLNDRRGYVTQIRDTGAPYLHLEIVVLARREAYAPSTAVPTPPAIVTSPTISGTTNEGETLTCSPGSASGFPSPSPSYQWQTSADGSTGWADISGATSSTYVLTSGEVGEYLRCLVTWTSTEGTAGPEPSNVLGPVAAAAVAPSNTVAPTIAGTPHVGQTLTISSEGTWTGDPPDATTYQWNRDGSPISGATSSTYTLVSADEGASITLDLTYSNAGGSDTATSNALGPVIEAPSYTAAPTISGDAHVGDTLTASTGVWDGTQAPPTVVTYQWRRSIDDINYTNISGATASTYVPVAGDTGYYIRVITTATNAAGSDSATSAATARVIQAPIVATAPTISGTVEIGQTLTVTNGTYTGSLVDSYTHQWQRSADGSTGWADISGATNTTYELVHADHAQYIRVVEVATNAAGSSASNPSAATTQVRYEFYVRRLSGTDAQLADLATAVAYTDSGASGAGFAGGSYAYDSDNSSDIIIPEAKQSDGTPSANADEVGLPYMWDIIGEIALGTLQATPPAFPGSGRETGLSDFSSSEYIQGITRFVGDKTIAFKLNVSAYADGVLVAGYDTGTGAATRGWQVGTYATGDIAVGGLDGAAGSATPAQVAGASTGTTFWVFATWDGTTLTLRAISTAGTTTDSDTGTAGMSNPPATTVEYSIGSENGTSPATGVAVLEFLTWSGALTEAQQQDVADGTSTHSPAVHSLGLRSGAYLPTATAELPVVSTVGFPYVTDGTYAAPTALYATRASGTDKYLENAATSVAYTDSGASAYAYDGTGGADTIEAETLQADGTTSVAGDVVGDPYVWDLITEQALGTLVGLPATGRETGFTACSASDYPGTITEFAGQKTVGFKLNVAVWDSDFVLFGKDGSNNFHGWYILAQSASGGRFFCRSYSAGTAGGFALPQGLAASYTGVDFWLFLTWGSGSFIARVINTSGTTVDTRSATPATSDPPASGVDYSIGVRSTDGAAPADDVDILEVLTWSGALTEAQQQDVATGTDLNGPSHHTKGLRSGAYLPSATTELPVAAGTGADVELG